MKFLLSIALIGMCHVFFAQTNTPCGAPALTPGILCLNTLGSTVGATYQNNAANGGTPSCAFPGAPDVWYSFTAPITGGVTITTSAGSITDAGMALYSGPCTALTQVQCNDNANSTLMPEITNLSLVPGQVYYIRVWKWNSGTGTFNICLRIKTPPTGNATCANPSPICSGSPINFTANTGGTPATSVNPSNNYGCLGSSPNPSWYYLKIATPGNLVIDIVAGSDVDYAIWGPFASVPAAQASCNSYGTPLDCSFSTAATEQANVPGVTVGQVYILLVTNYANTIQNINVNQSATNTATTDCSIVPLPVGYFTLSAVKTTDGVVVNWTTESEQNNDYFIVERSKTGQIWEAIGMRNGNGNSDVKHDYSYLDAKPYEGVSYYRLKQVDRDGKENYSDIMSVSAETKTQLSVYPNPASTSITLKNYGAKVTNVRIISLQGTTILMESFNDSQEVQVNIQNTPNGYYLIEAQLDNGTTELRKINIVH